MTRFRVDINGSAMLLDDDVMADRQAEACALACRFRCEKRIEHSLPDLRRNPAAIVANLDLNAVARIFRRRRQGGLVAISTILHLRLVGA